MLASWQIVPQNMGQLLIVWKQLCTEAITVWRVYAVHTLVCVLFDKRYTIVLLLVLYNNTQTTSVGPGDGIASLGMKDEDQNESVGRKQSNQWSQNNVELRSK